MNRMKKNIHYCWFGRNPKSKLILKCIDSWKKHCPDYEIKEWNEDNFDINCCEYVREAYEAKKWAFVSDYCRFWVLYHYGGIYLDTDVELIKPLNQFAGSFVGFEDEKRLNSGLIRGATKGDKVCKLMLDSYDSSRFRMTDGKLDLLTVCDRETDIFLHLGMVLENKKQTIENTDIYPSEFFNPTDLNTGETHITSNTVSIHHYAASWVDDKSRFRGKVYKFMRRTFGEKFTEGIRKIVGRK